MTNVLLRNVDEKLDKTLRLRAVEHGWTREAEIKSILAAAVATKPRKRPFSEALRAIPTLDVDVDTLFKRPEADSRPVDLDN